VVIALAGFEALFILAAAMFASAALLCLTLPSAPKAGTAVIGLDVAGVAASRTRRNVGEALRFLRTAPVVTWCLVYIALTYTLVAVAGALAPGFVREVLGVGERNTIILVGPAGIGVVAGLGALNLVSRRLRPARVVGVGLLVTMFALLALAGSRPLTLIFRGAASAQLGEAFPFFVAIVAVTSFVFGIAYAFITVPAMTMLQEELHDEIRGRIFGVLNMLVSVFSFLPLLVVGPIADVWGIAPVFFGAAGIVGVVYFMGRETRATRALPD
jgi:DHA3 family macrolide efflux protein-like MFS transporter